MTEHLSCYQRGLGASTYFSRPRRNALNLCLLCLSWGSSPTRTCRLNKACVFGPWKMGWEEEEKIYTKGGGERERERQRQRERKESTEESLAVKLGTHRPINICILFFALFSILDTKINQYWLMGGKMRDRKSPGFIIIIQGGGKNLILNLYSSL